jgi:hypothetical protein
LATVLPSTCTVSSRRFPFTTSTSTPGSFRNASAKLAACSRVPAQVGHSRMVIFVMTGLPPIRIRLHPLGTTSLSRVSRLPPLVVVLIRALQLGAVKCAKPRSCMRRPTTPTRSRRPFDASVDPTNGTILSENPYSA